MPNQPSGGFPAVYHDVPSEHRLNMKSMYELDVYDIKYLHFHKYIEIGMCISGCGICCIDGEEYPFKAGDIQIIFPYMNHLHRSDPPTPAKWYWLSTGYSELLECIGISDSLRFERDILPHIATYGTIDKTEFPKTYACLKNMFAEAIDDPSSEYAKQKIALKFYLAFIYLLEESQGRPAITFPENNKDIAKITPALSEIARRIEAKESLSVAEIAHMCNYSETNFRRIFTRYFKCSPQQYISFCRIRMAKKLLANTNLSITDIADTVGFDNISGFNRSFKNIAGITPSEYRKQSGH